MAKIKFNPIVEQVSGGFGDIVFREVNGKTILARKPEMSSTGPSQAQAAQRERFRQAVAYGKFVMGNSTARVVYDIAAEQKGIPAFALTVADFLNAPSIDDVDVSLYNGQIADKIMIITSDDFGVATVHVAVTDAQGASIESGNAIEYPMGSGHWTYTARVAVPAGTAVNIQVTAADRPGGTAVGTQSKTF